MKSNRIETYPTNWSGKLCRTIAVRQIFDNETSATVFTLKIVAIIKRLSGFLIVFAACTRVIGQACADFKIFWANVARATIQTIIGAFLKFALFSPVANVTLATYAT